MNPKFDFKYGNTELRFVKEVRDVSDLYNVYEIRCMNNNKDYSVINRLLNHGTSHPR